MLLSGFLQFPLPLQTEIGVNLLGRVWQCVKHLNSPDLQNLCFYRGADYQLIKGI